MPIGVLALLSAAMLFKNITGYSSTNDVDSIIGWIINALGAVIVICLTGFTQYFMYGYRNLNGSITKLSDDIFDACVTSFLLVLFSVIVFGWVL